MRAVGYIRVSKVGCGADDLESTVTTSRTSSRHQLMSLKTALWSVVIALLVYGIVLYARGDFA